MSIFFTGERSQWNKILVLPCRSCSWCIHVHDWNCRSKGTYSALVVEYQSVTTAVLFGAELTGKTIINPTYIIFLLSRFFTLVIFHVRKIVILWLLRFPVFHQMSLSLWVGKKNSHYYGHDTRACYDSLFCWTSINSQSIFLDKYMYPVRKLIILFERMHIWMSNWTGLCYHQHL